MTRDAATLVRAVGGENIRTIDLGVARGRPFAIMASVGPDASVIHRVNAGRDRPIRHLSYALPIVAEICRPSLPRLTIDIEGPGGAQRIADSMRGWVVIANLRQYGLRVDPCRHAVPDDGLLDIAFFPSSFGLRTLRWLIRSRLRCNDTALARALGARHARAHRIVITAIDAAPAQIDGEVGGVIEPNARIELGVAPGALRVLVP
jgi:diacylglycerol kinase family enzyme